MAIKNDIYKICPKCLNYQPMGLGNWCGACKHNHLLSFSYEYDDSIEKWYQVADQEAAENAAKLRNNPEFSEKAYNKRIKNSAESYNRRAEREYSNAPQSSPKCPTCGSTNVAPISTAKRAAGGIMFGMFSSTFGKSYECKDCKYKW